MLCPGTYPTVLNGKESYSDNNTVEFECLSGFFMTGTKRITCTSGVWQTSPTCSAIRQYDEVSVSLPDWWLLALAIILGLAVVACFLCLICYFCCCRPDNAIYPYRHRHSAACCGGGRCSAACCRCCEPRREKPVTVEEGEEAHDGVYFVPVHSTPTQGKYLIVSPAPASKNRSTSTNSDDEGKKSKTKTDSDRKRKIRTKNTGTNTDDTDGTTTGHNKSNHMYGGDGGGGPNGMANGTLRTSDSYAWGTTRSERGAGKGLYSKAWQDSSQLETHSDGDLNERSYRAKRNAKEVKGWMPHARPIRKINTSTK